MSRFNIKREGGFTLLELLIVIVIIGILALLIIPNITSAPKKARDTDRKTALRTVQKGLEEYFVSNNAYPVASGVVHTVLDPTLSPATDPIIKDLPKDPKGDGATAPYTYLYDSADGLSYTLRACLENSGDSSANVKAAVAPCTTKTFELVNNN